jgi:hypothetical protein
MGTPRLASPVERSRGPWRRLVPGLGLLLLAASLVGGCASMGGKGGGDDTSMRDAPVTLSVRNYNWNTVHIYVMGAGQNVSLGQLSSMDTATYVIPRSILASDRSVRLIADPIGSRQAYISDPVFVTAGDRIEWTINNALAQSVISVR